MQHKHLQFGDGFRVVLGDGHSQAAQMTLEACESEGGTDNRHRGADPAAQRSFSAGRNYRGLGP